MELEWRFSLFSFSALRLFGFAPAHCVITVRSKSYFVLVMTTKCVYLKIDCEARFNMWSPRVSGTVPPPEGNENTDLSEEAEGKRRGENAESSKTT